MARYSVHLPPSSHLLASNTSRQSQFERAIFVRDGYHAWASLFGPLWLVRHGHYLVALLLAIGLGFCLLALGALHVPDAVQMGVIGLLLLLIGLEASSLRRLALRLRGFQEVGIVVGDDLDTLERRFFAAESYEQSAVLAQKPQMSAFPAPPSSPSILGLFPTKGGRP